MTAENATLVDVAKKAGVALVTASRALNGSGVVAAKTLARIRAAAEQLGYSPNLSAKVLKGGRTNVLGLLVSDLQSPVITEIIGAVGESVRRAGLDLLIYNATSKLGDPDRQDVSRVLGGICDGLLLVLPAAKPGSLEGFETARVPVVLMNYWRTETSLPTVRGDNYEGARAAVAHLIALGHERIAFIGGSSFTGQSQERQRAYTDALRAAGLPRDKALRFAGDFAQPSGFAAAQALMALPEPPTAIFAANDLMAFGAMDALKAAGLRIPQDVSIVGFDDIPAAAHVHPRLTTVRQPLAEISAQAVEMLLARLRDDAAPAPQQVELPSALILRESTGAAPGRG